MLLSLTEITPPASEPVTLAQLKQHLRVSATFTDDDALLTTYITAARRVAERLTRRAFFTQTLQMTLDHFPQTYMMPRTVNPSMRRDWPYYAGIWTNSTIAVPKPLLQSVSSIKYLDGTGTQQTLASTQYLVDPTSMPGRIVPGPGLWWPIVTAYMPGSVQIQYVAGSYQASAPEDIQVAIMLLCAQWYAHPEATSIGGTGVELPFAVTSLLSGHRVDVLDFASVV